MICASTYMEYGHLQDWFTDIELICFTDVQGVLLISLDDIFIHDLVVEDVKKNICMKLFNKCYTIGIFYQNIVDFAYIFKKKLLASIR